MKPATYILLLLSLLAQSACTKEKPHDEKQGEVVRASIGPIKTTVKMVYIPGGEYMPFYGAIDSNAVKVPAFLIDERAVTNEEFLSFVTANPQWRKSSILRIHADTNYLRDWPSDLELPKDARPDAPVCFVSWFAAKAFAKSAGKRLPTLDEWEFIAMADADTFNARSKKQYSDAIIQLYMEKGRQFKPVKQSAPNYWGVYNVFDLIWEWTDDFNSIMSIGDSRTGGENNNKDLFCAAGATSASEVNNYAAFMRFGMRTAVKAHYTIANMGFRCAKDTSNQTTQ